MAVNFSNYLKNDEVTNYVTRLTATSGKETQLARAATAIIDAYCGRSLYIQHYKARFDMSAARVGWCRQKPIIAIDPRDTTTGFRITALARNIRGEREGASYWTDITIPSPLDDLITLASGRVDLKSAVVGADMGRQWHTVPDRLSNLVGFQAELEVLAGYFPSAKLTVAAANGASTLTVNNKAGLVANESYINVGDKKAEYLVTGITGLVLTISPVLVASVVQPVGTVVSGVIPEDVKCACAMIIEDRLTFEPNMISQTGTLDIISDRFRRADVSAMPVDAQLLLRPYVLL